MPKHPLRLRESDYTLIADALENYEAYERNFVCLDFVESHGIEAAREHEKRALHAANLLDRIRRARS